ncbi:hypothetical protein DMUE_0632 [Dictyocoela muelleri]|nr:hypothetical protein DMUE_0632 [Dictyocoela muelleri]
MFDEEFFNILLESTKKLQKDQLDEDTKIRIECNIESLLLQLDELDDLNKKRKYLNEIKNLKQNINSSESGILSKKYNNNVRKNNNEGKNNDNINNDDIKNDDINIGEMLIFSRKLREKAEEFDEMIKKDSAVLDEGLKGVQGNVAGLDRNIHKITQKKKDLPVFTFFVLAIVIFFVMYCLIYIF